MFKIHTDILVSKKVLFIKKWIICIFTGHDIIVDHPWHETWYKNGVRYYKISTVQYCKKCKRIFK